MFRWGTQGTEEQDVAEHWGRPKDKAGIAVPEERGAIVEIYSYLSACVLNFGYLAGSQPIGQILYVLLPVFFHQQYRVKDCTFDNRCQCNYLLSISSTLQYLLPQCYHPRAYSSSLPVEAMDLLVDHFSAFHIGIFSFRLDLQLYICPQASLQTDQV